MAFQLSPGVLVTEKDLTSIVPAVATSTGAYAGPFQWGPVEQVTTVESENRLVELFGKPNDTVFKSFFTAANFLSYGNDLKLIRSADQSIARNSTASEKLVLSSVTLAGTGLTLNNEFAGGGAGTSNANITIAFSEPLLPGGETATGYGVVAANTLGSIVITSAGSGYNTAPTVTITNVQTGSALANATATAVMSNTAILITNSEDYDANHSTTNGYNYGVWASKYPGALGNSLKVSMADGAVFSGWTYEAQFDSAPNTSSYVSAIGATKDELHIIVVDEDGLWTGERGTVLEKFPYVSKHPEAVKSDGSRNYYKDVINSQSKYIWWVDHPVAGVSNAAITAGTTIAWGETVANGQIYQQLASAYTVSLAYGVSGDSPTAGNIQTSYSEFANDEKHDISLIAAGDATVGTINYLIGSVAEVRKDCVVFASPLMTDVVNTSSQATKIVNTRANVTSSSYAVMDSGWKYQYDRYNDKYRWIPMNGDTAGLAARTDYVADPWFSPAGLNRGIIKNVVKLAYTPSKTDRDTLYKNGVNPIVSFPGQGTVLFGDKTLQAKPSAFDRINVRRLFIVLEKAIATAAKFQLFEFNDAFTRSQFKNLVEPYLRDVQGRRGITDFKVVCDETNNTGEVIDRNEFVADIYIKPARAINFIQLNFVATRTGISFEEIGA